MVERTERKMVDDRAYWRRAFPVLVIMSVLITGIVHAIFEFTALPFRVKAILLAGIMIASLFVAIIICFHINKVIYKKKEKGYGS